MLTLRIVDSKSPETRIVMSLDDSDLGRDSCGPAAEIRDADCARPGHSVLSCELLWPEQLRS